MGFKKKTKYFLVLSSILLEFIWLFIQSLIYFCIYSFVSNYFLVTYLFSVWSPFAEEMHPFISNKLSSKMYKWSSEEQIHL